MWQFLIYWEKKNKIFLTSGGNQEKAVRISCENYDGLAGMLLSTADVNVQNDGTISYIFIFDFKASRLNLHVIALCCYMQSSLGLGWGIKQNVVLYKHSAVGIKFITQTGTMPIFLLPSVNSVSVDTTSLTTAKLPFSFNVNLLYFQLNNLLEADPIFHNDGLCIR